ncbi:aromatase/cyclase [Streptomyces sp. UP1A-1]|nr:aromatase/cyclase [Streptomyces sp. UP1A-1]
MTAPAPSGVLYGLIADATVWPLFFPPSVHVEQLDFDGTRERLRMWAVAGDRISSWVSHRRLDVGQRQVEFRQERPSAPVETMTGLWTVEPLGDGSRVTLEHAFTVIGDAPADAAWTERVTRANSRAQLQRLAWLAERWTRLDDLVMSFEDTVRVNVPAELVFDFLYRAGDWPDDLARHPPPDGAGGHPRHPGPRPGRPVGHRRRGGAHQLPRRSAASCTNTPAHPDRWPRTPASGPSSPSPELGLDVTVRHDVLLNDDAALDQDAARRACDEVGRA